MKLTIVTATYNAIDSGNREALIRCIESIDRLTVDHEHLVYDGASVDGTVELLRECATRVPSLRVVSEKDTGIYNALNKGVRDASGEWFYVLGCDDCIRNGEYMVRALEIGDKAKADVVVTPVFISPDDDRVRTVYRGLEFCCTYPHQGVLMRTELIRSLGGFDERYRLSADYDLTLRALQAAARVVFAHEAFAYFSCTGVSSCQSVTEDYARIRCARLGLTSDEEQLLVRCRVLPWRVTLRYLAHRSPQLRKAARYHCLRSIMRALGLMTNEGVMRWNMTRTKGDE